MERCVKYAYHRCVGHNLLAGFDTDNVRGIVKRCKRYALFKRLHNSFGDYTGISELLRAVYDSVTNSADLVH